MQRLDAGCPLSAALRHRARAGTGGRPDPSQNFRGNFLVIILLPRRVTSAAILK